MAKAKVYNLTMPDGEVLKNIPIEVPRDEVHRRWKEAWVEKNYTETPRTDVSMQDIEKVRGEEYTGSEKFMAGVGQGMTNIARNVGNITGFVSDEEMEQRKEQDAPLLSTGAGMTGSLTGEVAALAPLGPAVAGGQKLIQGANVARTLGPVVQGLSKSRTAALGAEGAAGGAIAAGPNNRALGASTGLGFGAGFGAAVDTAKRLSKGFVMAKNKVSPQGSELEGYLGKELSHSIVGVGGPEGGYFRFALTEMIPYLPGGGEVAKQFKAADADVVKYAIKMATPDGLEVKDVAGLQKAFADGYDSALSGRTFDFSAADWRGASGETRRIVNDAITKYADDGVVSGTNVAKVRGALIEKVDKSNLPGMEDIIPQFDEMVKQRMLRSGTGGRAISKAEAEVNQRAIEMYEGLAGKYDNFRRVAKAAEAQEGLSSTTLAGAARDLSPLGAAPTHTGPMQKFADTAASLLGKELPNPSLWGRIASLTAIGGIGGGYIFDMPVVGGVAVLALGYGIGRGGGSKGFQNFMVGRTGPQKAGQRVAEYTQPEAASVASQSNVQQQLEIERLEEEQRRNAAIARQLQQ